MEFDIAGTVAGSGGGGTARSGGKDIGDQCFVDGIIHDFEVDAIL
jgi:hypothetical protein